MIQNEVYVSMSELNFPIQLIRLTAATLNRTLCCIALKFGKLDANLQCRTGDNRTASKTTNERHYMQLASSKHKYLADDIDIEVESTKKKTQNI
jgi:hypothetical protein